MSKLYISEKTLNKLSDSKINQNYLKTFKRFDIEHSKPKQPQIKTKQSQSSNITPELSQDEKIQIAIQEMRKAFAENKNSYHYSAKKAKKLSEELKAKKRKTSLERLSKQSAPKKTKVIKLKKKHTTTKKSTEPLVHSLDYDNPAAEYESRQVEFGHGRAKSKEWNDEVAREFQKELKQTHKQKPDWTDRFALK